jgi:tetratricopeptide (TPR) repeat protein
MTRGAPVPLALVALCSLATGAAAAPAKVAIAPFAPASGDVPVSAGEKLAALLAAQLEGSDAVAPAALPAEANPAAEQALKAAREAIGAAQERARKGKHSSAAGAYREAVASFQAAAALLEDSAELADAHAALAAELYLTANDDEAKRELESAVSLAPKRAFAGEATSPLFAAVVRRAREASASLERSRIRFESTPDRARVQLDGAEAGRTPLEIRDVPAGEHLFRILLPTGRVEGGVLQLSGARAERAGASLGGSGPQAKLLAALSKGRLDAEAANLASQTAAGAGAEFLVFGCLVVQGSDLALESFLYSAARGEVARLPAQRFDLELLSAGTALFKVAGEIAARVERFGEPERIPGPIFRFPAPAAAELTEVGYASLAPGDPPERPLAPRGPRRPIDPKRAGALRPREK